MRMIFNVADNAQQQSSSVNSDRAPSHQAPSTPSPTPSSIPVYYYRSKTPAIHTSDYIYYYSPRDLVQLKLKAKTADRNIENEVVRAGKLTSSAISMHFSGWLLALVISVSALQMGS